ncbi:MAG: hypothetical protein U1E23_14890 [Reyranellaceae bacterium]
MVVGEIYARLQGFNAILNSAKALAQMHDERVRLEASLELQREIFAMQQEYAAVARAKDEAEAKIVSFERWEREKKRYQPQVHEPGVTVYVLKPAEKHADLGQHFCPQCYANRQARILQQKGQRPGARRVRVCLECKAELAYGPAAPPGLRCARSGRLVP